MTRTVTPAAGSARAFDGQDDYVMVADDPSLDVPDSFMIKGQIRLCMTVPSMRTT
jgi:hypothetical protein